nr:HAD family hydrolase [uncultured Treponema sp.]
MDYIPKIAVFDLDGTLWKVNSHHELLNLYYKTHFFSSFSYRVLFRLFPFLMKKIRNLFFEKIPDDFINSVNFDFTDEIVDMLNTKKSSGFKILIISNAPRELIISNAAKRLNCDYLCALAGEKLKILNLNYKYSELFVCTDNPTDLDLISSATKYFLIFPNARIKHFFMSRGFKND